MTRAEELEAITSLREVAECLLDTQKAMGEDVAEMASAITENTKATEQLGNLLVEGIGRLGSAIDKLVSLEERFGAYVQDSAKQQSGIRDVDRRLRVLEGGVGGER
jgi:hypothetical protein